MGIFYGKRRKGLFLTIKKHKRLSFGHPVSTSTPVKKDSNRKSGNKFGARRTPGKSPLTKKLKLSPPPDYVSPRRWIKPRRTLLFKSAETELSDFETESDLEGKDDDTILYSDAPCQEEDSVNPAVTMQSTEIEAASEEENSVHDLLDAAIKSFETHNIKSDFVTFLKLVLEGRFPLNNVAFMLFLDVVKWFSTEDVRSVRYSDTTMKFFWLGKRLFGGRFLRFMSGPKNETDLIRGKSIFSPTESKINFACPSDIALAGYDPFGYEISADSGPGIIQEMIDLVAKNRSSCMSYVLMFDGKKMKRGADTDLLGFESEPISTKKAQYEADICVVQNTLHIVKTLNNKIEDNRETTSVDKTELFDALIECFELFSKYLMSMRRTRKSKELALSNFKEKVTKDPSLGKTLQYAMDSCRTCLYMLDNCIGIILDAQWDICKVGAYLNGVIDLFAKSKTVDIDKQENVKLLKSVEETKSDLNITDNLPTNMVKQRSEEWFRARRTVRVTGSVLYNAIGCDGLKHQNEHFDSVFSNKTKLVTEIQEKAMKHGNESEPHAIATLASVIMPFLYPTLVYFEEGYYQENGIIISPDGSLKDRSTGEKVYAFECKAPVNNKFVTRQHYKVPERYILQTLFEQKCMKACAGTIYLCWTPESTTVFIVPENASICSKTVGLVQELYHSEVPKRRTKVLKETKDLKSQIKLHSSECVYIGEFPSVNAGSLVTEENVNAAGNGEFGYDDLARSLLKAQAAMKDAYNIARNYASQVLVYLLSDLDRMWKSELPHAVPVMYAYRGYSLSMDIARNLLEHCKQSCYEKGIDVIATASDGEFVQLMVRGKQGQPLTLYQLNKTVWKDVCKHTKAEMVKIIGSLNNKYNVIRESNHRITLESQDGGGRIRTPRYGWQSRTATKKNRIVDHEPVKKTANGEAETLCDNDRISEGDDTIVYDFECLLERTNEENHCQDQTEFPRQLTSDEKEAVLHLLKGTGRSKWHNATPDIVADTIRHRLHTLTKDELLDISKYLNLKLIGTRNEIKVTKVKKDHLLQQLKLILRTDTDVVKARKMKSTRRYNPKHLRDIAINALKKAKYPKKVLNIAYATYVWPDRVRKWKHNARVADKVTVQLGSENISFQPYYVPEFDAEYQDFQVFTYDKTHLGTNLRKYICLDRVAGISVGAWKIVSEKRPDLLHPSVIEVSEGGKILDQMKEKLARSMVTTEIEHDMMSRGFIKEAEFCKVVREGLYVADDTPGISAIDRAKMRMALMEWLDRGIDFGRFPPYGGRIKGLSHILYEGLRASQEAKLYLYALAKAGTYCVRAPNTLCSESFFGAMQDMDPWGQGILSAKGVQKHMSDFTTITAMKMAEDRNVYIKTKKDTVYPAPSMTSSSEQERDEDMGPKSVCTCRKDMFISCIIPRNHFFDTQERARVHKEKKPYRPSTPYTDLRGEQPIRAQYGYKINEARMLPSKRLGLGGLIDHDDELGGV